MYKKVYIHIDLKLDNIAQAFCSLYGFEILENKYVKYIEHDLIIDIGTEKIYKPKKLYTWEEVFNEKYK